MVEERWTQIRVGLFVVVGLILMMATIFMLAEEQHFFRQHYKLKTSFDNVSGLAVGATVLLAGIDVGTVDDIVFDPDLANARVEVTMSIDKHFQDRIRADSVASTVTKGVLGDKIISISLGSAGQPILKEGDMLKSAKQLSLFELAEEGGNTLRSLNRVAEAMNSILKEIETGQGLIHDMIYESDDRQLSQNVTASAKELRVASRELQEILAKINNGEGTMGALVNDPSLYNDIRRLFGKIQRNALLRTMIRSRIRDLEQEEMQQQ